MLCWLEEARVPMAFIEDISQIATEIYGREDYEE